MLLTVFGWTFLSALLLMLFAPESRLGKAARETLVEAPARLLLDMTWAKAGRMALLAPVFVLLMLAGPEMIALLAMLGGDLAALELLLAVWAASVSGGLSATFRNVAARASRLWRSVIRARQSFNQRGSHRARRGKQDRKPRKDEDEPVGAFA